MPEEQINYTICWMNETLWAKVDGTYPVSKIDFDCQTHHPSANDSLFTFSGDSLQMFYPTPPRTTNISIKMDSTDLDWSNYTQSYPDVTHYTAVGNWPMISCNLYPVVDDFTLRIHYEHPVKQINGSYTFLYDLNISPYLSSWSNKSTAYFSIRFETNYTNLQVNTITLDDAMKNPVNYTITEDDKNEIISLQVVSNYYENLPGDLLISFDANKNTDPDNSDFSGSSLPTEFVCILTVAMGAILVVLLVYLRHHKSK
ncbi:MAG: hypothetical protein QCH99_00280 [Candidatus Bathyarchaeota archaeon]|nr:hypothetical protein [Candidatus Bathyarchaeum tardum]